MNTKNIIVGLLGKELYRDKITNYVLNMIIMKREPVRIHKLRNKAFYINTVNSGGSFYFIDDIKKSIEREYDIVIVNVKNIELLKHTKSNDIILINHLIGLENKITDIIRQKNKVCCKLFIFIHDFYWLNYELPRNGYLFHTIYTKENNKINSSVYDLFKYATKIIFPTKFMYDNYEKYFNTFNFIMHDWIDYEINLGKISISNIKNNTINIGILNTPCKIKGSCYVDWLKNNLRKYKQYKIQFYIVGENVIPYKNIQKDFNELIRKLNIHLILLFNTFGESWCYYLTKCLNTGVPLFYNNIGSFRERINKKENHFICFDKELDINLDIEKAKLLLDKISVPLEYIIKNEGKNIGSYSDFPSKNNLYAIYKILTNIKTCIKKNSYEEIHTKIKPYAIYFPQFHYIKENDYNFYPGYTDTVSLKKLKMLDDNYNLCSPNYDLFNMKSIDEYNLLDNKSIIKTQIELAKIYGYLGFCIYYYFFSKNKITRNNLIMNSVLDAIFDTEFTNFNIFFNWANENWNDKLNNTYTEEDLNKNIDILINYFKKDKYLKIENKPVLLIHNPYYIKNSELTNIEKIFNKKCIDNDFSGIHIVFNGLCANDIIKSKQTFYHSPFHHKVKSIGGNLIKTNNDSNSNEMVLDYLENFNKTKHLNNKIDDIKVVYFNFNNKARKLPHLDKNKNTEYWTTCNNTYFSEKESLKYHLNFYLNNERTELQKIFLINSWNEWGEQMAIEPSNECGLYYLHLINEELKKMFDKDI
jgi:hypothetical protein